jgi:S-DNA-T family DNA segregation ATPase FtsK/SpoIIIE
LNRTARIAAASSVLAALALYSLASIAAALQGMAWPEFLAAPGRFLLAAFDYAAFGLPAALAWAAILAASKKAGAGGAVALALSAIPLILAGLGLKALRDPKAFDALLPFMAEAPRALSAGFLFALAACAGIAALIAGRAASGARGAGTRFEEPPQGGAEWGRPTYRALAYDEPPPTRKEEDPAHPAEPNALMKPGALLDPAGAKASMSSEPASEGSDAPLGARFDDADHDILSVDGAEESGPARAEPAASYTFRFSVVSEEAPAAAAECHGAGEADAAIVDEGPDDEDEGAEGPLDEAEDELPEAGPSAAELSERARAHEIAFTSVPPEARPHEEPVAPAKQRAGRKPASYHVPTDLLTVYPDGQYWVIDDATRRSADILRATLEEFRIQAEVTGIRKGPVITMFEILPAPGVKLSRIVNLQDNIALRLAASSIRIVAPIPGKHAVGIEVPNKARAIVSFREMIESESAANAKLAIPVVLGKDIAGEAQVIDLASMPHLLIAGATGAGKSVCVNSFILSVLYKRAPSEVKMILIDPKIVELKLYNDIPHLLTPVITEPKKAFQALQYCICEMERRYSMLDALGARDIKSYNRRVKEKALALEALPYIIVFIDEFADLMATTGKELESTLARLAAMSRAVGIHLVLATQRPSIDVITGLIKANIPSRIAFMVASRTDSRIIIDSVGAEKLLGKGDMLYASAVDPFPSRIQGAFVSEEEVERVVEYVKTLGEPDYIDDEIFIDDDEGDGALSLFDGEGEDPMLEQALEIVLQAGKASASYLQRRLKIGYNRAARLVEIMEEKGIVGPQQGSKARDIMRVPDR